MRLRGGGGGGPIRKGLGGRGKQGVAIGKELGASKGGWCWW